MANTNTRSHRTAPNGAARTTGTRIAGGTTTIELVLSGTRSLLMSDTRSVSSVPQLDGSSISPEWRVARAIGTALIVCTAMILLYGYAPEPVDFHLPSLIPLCLFFFAVYLVIIIALLRRVRDRKHLTYPGMMLLTVLLVFFVLSFSWLYRALESVNSGTFSEPFTDVSAIYFTIAVLSTVGFGDIRPLDDLSRAVVTIQMVLGVGLLAAAIGMVSRKTDRVIKELNPNPEPGAGSGAVPRKNEPG